MAITATPVVGSTGSFTLKAPFDKDVVATQTYVCIAVRRLDELLALAVDPYAEYYVRPHELDESIYQRDLIDKVSICTLRADTGQLIYVPSSYIAKFPALSGVAYRPMALAVSIGAIPDKTNLGPLKGEIKELVLGALGLKDSVVEVVEATLGSVEIMDYETHRQIEAARKAAISRLTTDHSMLLEAQQTIASQATLIKHLEAEVIRLSTPSTP